MSLSMFSLVDKVAIVTGSAHGIGRAIALEFAKAGADVVITGINIYDPTLTESDLEAVASEVRSLGRRALTVPADFRHAEQVDNLVAKAMAEFGRIDIMVNNAGGMFFSSLLETSNNAWNAILQENLTSTFFCCKAVGKIMVQQNSGCIVNIASGAGMHAFPQAPHYAAAKAGVINLTKSLALELAPYSIRVTGIAPAFIEHESRTVGRKGSNQPQTDEERAARIKAIPLRRAGQPRDIAAAALYLSSEAAQFVTGITLVVDGGTSLGMAI